MLRKSDRGPIGGSVGVEERIKGTSGGKSG